MAYRRSRGYIHHGSDRLAITTLDALFDELMRRAAVDAARNDRRGYFGALYALMTGRVREERLAGRFTRGDELERLACHFAARYLDAYDRYEAGERAANSWTVAFEAAARWRPVILQHLFLGMNAHINFDLGIAAAEVADGGDLQATRADFTEINALLAELMEDVQVRLASVSPWMGILDRLGGRKDDAIVNFSMRRARDAAWRFAERYHPMSAEERREAEAALDAAVARFAGVILRPGKLLTVAAVPVRFRERRPVADVITALSSPETAAV